MSIFPFNMHAIGEQYFECKCGAWSSWLECLSNKKGKHACLSSVHEKGLSSSLKTHPQSKLVHAHFILGWKDGCTYQENFWRNGRISFAHNMPIYIFSLEPN